MNISLSPKVQKLIQQRMKRGGYATPDDVVLAALAILEQSERFGDFEPGELDALVAEGDTGGPTLDGDAVFAELRALRNRRREKAG